MKHPTLRILLFICLVVLLARAVVEAPLSVASGIAPAVTPACESAVCIDHLEALTIDALRQESWNGYLEHLKPLQSGVSAKTARAAGNGYAAVRSFMLSFFSDDLRQYARLDTPSASPPTSGYPLVVFFHGWVGSEEAATYAFAADSGSLYREIISELNRAGFAVLTPGFRGHGTFDGAAAQGGEWLDAWDNGSYLSPVFYARDALNLLHALRSFDGVEYDQSAGSDVPRLDIGGVSLLGHSQGGDSLLMVLAIAGGNPRISVPISSAAIWAGNIADRFTQANTFGPMGSTLQAFMSGDGTWTASALSKEGVINRDFVFAWPPDWISTLDPSSADWDWQEQVWSLPNVAVALDEKYREMYDTINAFVRDIDDADYVIMRDDEGRLFVDHDPRIAAVMPRIGGYLESAYINQPLNLHFSDQDYYSLPEWNRSLAACVNQRGGSVQTFLYPATNHSLRASKHRWYSPPGTLDGVGQAIARDIQLFSQHSPAGGKPR